MHNPLGHGCRESGQTTFEARCCRVGTEGSVARIHTLLAHPREHRAQAGADADPDRPSEAPHEATAKAEQAGVIREHVCDRTRSILTPEGL
jgi:hypothetical protein